MITEEVQGNISCHPVIVICFSKHAVKRKVCDEHRQFQVKWEIKYFLVKYMGTPMSFICTEKVVVQKKYNVKTYFPTRLTEEYAKYLRDERECGRNIHSEAIRFLQEGEQKE